MLRRVVLSMVAGFALTAPTLAADIIRPIVQVPVVQPNPFHGFYAGGHVGYGWGNRKGCFQIFHFPAESECSDPYPDLGDPHPFDYDQRGWLIGGQVGLNHVIGRSGFLVGAEVTASLSGISGNLDLDNGNQEPRPLQLNGGNAFLSGVGTYPWLATATAKIGWTGGNWMIYAEGGVGLGGFNFRAPACSFDSVNQGTVFGIGAEVAVSKNNSLFIEWNRMNFDNKDAACGSAYIVLGDSLALPIPIGVNTDPQIDVVRFGFNHYFN